jgi:DNA-binding winged helix-turn-helix (wHTH) protein/tetratricopeptide (TPR) repeat protein
VPHPVYQFGDCRIDVSSRELRRRGELVVLSPKVFDCLAYLIERHARAVGRDELVAAVWGKTEITDTLLGQTILKARRAVGDSADRQDAIRTIPRFGYAWVAALSPDDAQSMPSAPPPPAVAPVSPPIEQTAAPAAESPRARFLSWIAIGAMVAIACFWLFNHFMPREKAAPAAPHTAAVMPVHVTAPAEWAWVRLGLMDAIAARLRDADQPVVPSDNVVALARPEGGDESGGSVRQATGAEYVVTSSASWSPSGWNVHLELRGDGTTHSADAQNADVLLAGRAATDRLLTLIGKTPPADAGDPQQWADAKLLQRAEAALLTNDLDGARHLLQSAPAELQKSPELRLRLAKIDFRAGDFDGAARTLRELLDETPAETDALMRGRILNGIGNVDMRRGRVDQAIAAYEEAVSVLENRNAPAELGQAYMGRGIAAQTQGRFDAALGEFAKAHIAFELAGDGLALARVEANEGMLDAARDRYAAAVPTLARAAERFERFGTLNELAMTTSAQIDAQLALLDAREALAASDRAWPALDRLANARIRHALAINRARALDANGQRQKAIGLLRDVLGTADAEQEKIVLAAARAELARIEWMEGHAQAAADLALAAVPILGDADEAGDRITASLVAIRALRALGRTREADEQVAQLETWARTIHQPTATLHAQLARAEQLAAAGDREAAGHAYDQALALATQGSVPEHIVEVAASYGPVLIAAGELERASAVIGQVARWADRDFAAALLQVRLYAGLGKRDAWQNALTLARALGGDREIPADVSAFPGSIPGRTTSG